MKSELTDLARSLRKNSTDAERLLWGYLRGRQLDSLKFRRQHPLGNYIVDFICLEKKIIIEIDGGQHATSKEYDEERDRWLNNQGFKVLRFWNNDVIKNIDGVIEVIRQNCLKS
ncbi:TPA: endonuclease domain-containing protein [Candidatus Poribacteria bacterium]|nr:endonuclease domain-containing protein [Candidatus Poribacteria bacterium]